MTLPGTLVTQQDLAAPGQAPTATDTWFVAGTTATGPTSPTVVNSLAAFVAVYGDRQTYSVLYDALDVFFREGGGKAVVVRIVGPAAVDGGSDDRANITDTQRLAALSRFTKNLGPGQVSIPGATTDALHVALLDHAAAMNRVALLDAPDTSTVATLTTSSAAGRAASSYRFGALFAPWGVVPGVTANTTRDIPPSALVAGAIARSDTSGLSPNIPAAGENGISRYLLSVKATFVDSDRDTLNEAGVNVIRTVNSDIRIYGWRTLADPSTHAGQVFLGNTRMLMAITARADVIAERFVFDQIDGKGLKAAELAGDLIAMLSEYGPSGSGSLYGDTDADAYLVDVGPTVNTPTTIAAGELRAHVFVRISPHAEKVRIDITKKPITEAI